MSATLLRPPTRSGSLLPDAAQLVLPSGIVGSAFPAVEATCRQIGMVFDDWQRGLNRAILAKSADGLYAADTVEISIPRQVGKTFDIGGIVFADSIINPGTTTVWTAHRFKVARETFDSLVSMARSPLLEAHIDADAITTANGNECIPFRNGSRIVFAARERGSVRGFTKVRRLILDEGQILSESALSDMVPTLNQATNPQVILMGTPPKPSDPSEVFSNIRAEALAGVSSGVLYVEFAAPAGSRPDDRHAWRVANPSFPKRTPAKAIERMRKLLTVEDFMREALGMWDDSSVAATISSSVWSSLAVESVDVPDRGVRTYGVKFAVDGSSVAFAVAVNPKDGGAVHVELVDQQPLTGGIGWLVDWLAERAVARRRS
jgi:phage terminase large subunit-like protein